MGKETNARVKLELLHAVPKLATHKVQRFHSNDRLHPSPSVPVTLSALSSFIHFLLKFMKPLEEFDGYGECRRTYKRGRVGGGKRRGSEGTRAEGREGWSRRGEREREGGKKESGRKREGEKRKGGRKAKEGSEGGTNGCVDGWMNKHIPYLSAMRRCGAPHVTDARPQSLAEAAVRQAAVQALDAPESRVPSPPTRPAGQWRQPVTRTPPRAEACPGSQYTRRLQNQVSGSQVSRESVVYRRTGANISSSHFRTNLSTLHYNANHAHCVNRAMPLMLLQNATVAGRPLRGDPEVLSCFGSISIEIMDTYPYVVELCNNDMWYVVQSTMLWEFSSYPPSSVSNDRSIRAAVISRAWSERWPPQGRFDCPYCSRDPWWASGRALRCAGLSDWLETGPPSHNSM